MRPRPHALDRLHGIHRWFDAAGRFGYYGRGVNQPSPLPTAPGAAPAYPPPRPPSPPRPLGRLTTALTVLVPIAALAQFMVVTAFGISVDDASGGSGLEGPAISGILGTTGLLTFLVCYAASGICLLVWMFRARRNLAWLPYADPRWSPEWSIAAWLIPYANWVLGPLVLRDVARASLPPHDLAGRRRTAVVWAWVGCWTGAVVSTFPVFITMTWSDLLSPVDMVALAIVFPLLATSAASFLYLIRTTARAQAAWLALGS